LTASRVAPEKLRKAHLFQPDGYFSIDYLSQKAFFSGRGSASKGERGSESIAEEIPVRKIDSLEAEIQSFLQSVKGRRPALVSGRDGKRALELALRISRTINQEITDRKEPLQRI